MQNPTAQAWARDDDGGLAERLEAAHAWSLLEFAQVSQRLQPEVGAAWLEVAGGHAIYAGASSPFTLAIGTAMRAPIRVQELDRIEEFFLGRGVPPAVDVCPYTHPSLLELLWARAYRPREIISVLCRDLRGEFEDLAPVAPGVALRWAASGDQAAWIELLAEGFFQMEPGPSRRAALTAMFHVCQSLNALVFVEGELAGTGSLRLPPGEIAEMFGACTLPRFRGRGLHAALLQFRLTHAREQNCNLALATAIPGSDSERNLQKHGFRPIYQKRTWEKR